MVRKRRKRYPKSRNRTNSCAYPDDTHRDLVTGLSYLTGRTLTADNLRTAAANLGINRAELLTRYRLADLEEVTALAECIGSRAVTRLPCNLPRPSGLCSATLSHHGAGLID